MQSTPASVFRRDRRAWTKLPIWLIGIGMLVLVGLWSAFSVKVDYDDLMNHEYRLLDVRARQRAARLGRAMQRVDTALQSVVQDYQHQPRLPVGELRHRVGETLAALTELQQWQIVDTNGVVRFDSLGHAAGTRLADSQAYVHHQQHPQDLSTFAAQPLLGPVGQVRTQFSRSLRDAQGHGVGVVLVTLDPHYLEETLRFVTPDGDSEAMLVHQSGIIMAAVPNKDVLGQNLNDDLGFIEHRRADKTTTRQLARAKRRPSTQMSVYQEVTGTGLTVVVARDYDAVLAQWRGELVGHVLRFVALASALLFFAWVAQRRLQVLQVAHRLVREREAELLNYKAIVDHADDAIIGQTVDGVITTWNTGAQRLLGYTAAEAVGQPLKMLVPPDRHAAESRLLARIARGEHVGHFETVYRHKSGQLVDISETISPVISPEGVVVGASKIAKDITEKHAVERRVRFLASHDRLTELPNRDLFYDRLSQAISRARRGRQRLSVLYMDLDGFKALNDRFGHQVGDATLKEAARRLRGCVRDVDTVARLGGDEFAIILTDISAFDDAAAVAEKVIQGIQQPMFVRDGDHCQIGVSIGIATYPDCGVEIDRLMKSADAAMYESKRAGKNRFTYAASLQQELSGAHHWVAIRDDLRCGVAVIDEQHQTIVDMLNRLNVSVSEQDPHASLVQQLQEVVTYVAYHFDTEERLMSEHHYPLAEAHAHEHKRLVEEARHLADRFTDGGELLVLQWLKDWFVGHVSGADRQLSAYLLVRLRS